MCISLSMYIHTCIHYTNIYIYIYIYIFNHEYFINGRLHLQSKWYILETCAFILRCILWIPFRAPLAFCLCSVSVTFLFHSLSFQILFVLPTQVFRSKTLEPGSSIQKIGLYSDSPVPDSRPWILDLVSWIQDSGSWVHDPEPGSWILYLGSSLLDPGSHIQELGVKADRGHVT